MCHHSPAYHVPLYVGRDLFFILILQGIIGKRLSRVSEGNLDCGPLNSVETVIDYGTFEVGQNGYLH